MTRQLDLPEIYVWTLLIALGDGRLAFMQILVVSERRMAVPDMSVYN